MRAIIIRYDQTNPNPFIWILEEEIVVTLSDGTLLTIPKGFKTDFATIPQVFWSILPPIGRANLAFIIHDYLYQNKDSRGRKFADKEMLCWMKKLGLDKKKFLGRRPKTWIIYHVVRWKGSKYWNGKAGQY
jgi:hypothetical protein